MVTVVVRSAVRYRKQKYSYPALCDVTSQFLVPVQYGCFWFLFVTRWWTGSDAAGSVPPCSTPNFSSNLNLRFWFASWWQFHSRVAAATHSAPNVQWRHPLLRDSHLLENRKLVVRTRVRGLDAVAHFWLRYFQFAILSRTGNSHLGNCHLVLKTEPEIDKKA